VEARDRDRRDQNRLSAPPKGVAAGCGSVDRPPAVRYAGCLMTTLHFICGKAASGKTTLARRLAAQHEAALFCEDEWLMLLDAKIAGLADFVRYARPLRAALAPHLVQLLALGTSIVLDFAGNTPKDRAWTRSVFERAGADHVLHVITASDALCKERLRLRNETKPAGLYHGQVTEAQFDEVTRYFVAPSEDENFQVVHYDAATL
jgi:predicted kinase